MDFSQSSQIDLTVPRPNLRFPNCWLFPGWGRQPHAQPLTWRTRSPYLYPLETAWPSYTPSHWIPILVAFYDMHGLQWAYFFPRSPHGDIRGISHTKGLYRHMKHKTVGKHSCPEQYPNPRSQFRSGVTAHLQFRLDKSSSGRRSAHPFATLQLGATRVAYLCNLGDNKWTQSVAKFSAQSDLRGFPAGDKRFSKEIQSIEIRIAVSKSTSPHVYILNV
jgi:hypothetical protein